MAVDRIDTEQDSHFVVVQCLGTVRYEAEPIARDDAKAVMLASLEKVRDLCEEGKATDDLDKIVEYAHRLLLLDDVFNRTPPLQPV